MPNLLHIAETAILLLVAYQLGWFVGFVARRAVQRPVVVAGVPAERMAAATNPSEQPVRAPVIEPVIAVPIPVSAGGPKPPEEVPTAPLPDAFLDSLQTALLEQTEKVAEPQDAATSAAASAALEAALGLSAQPPPAAIEPVEPALAERGPPADEQLVPAAVELPAAIVEPPAETVEPPADAVAALTLAVEKAAEAVELIVAPPPEAVEPVISEISVAPPQPVQTPEAFDVAPKPAPRVKPRITAPRAAPPAPPAEAPAPVPAPTVADARPPRPALQPATNPGEAWSGRPIPPPKTAVPVAAVVEPVAYEVEASDEDAEAAAMRAIESGWTRKSAARSLIRDLPEGVPGKVK